MSSILRANSVSFRYPQNSRGFGPFSFAVQPGENILISGLSGSGKSTLARCLTGLIPHLYHGEFQGDVWLDGLRTDQVPLWRLVERAGFVFQNPALQMLAPTVAEEILFGLENLGLSRDEMQNRLEETLDRFGLESFSWLLSILDLERYETIPPVLLSEGEKRWVVLATILMHKPGSGILLDGPALGLDNVHQAILLRLLRALANQWMFVLLSMHDLELAAQADHFAGW